MPEKDTHQPLIFAVSACDKCAAIIDLWTDCWSGNCEEAIACYTRGWLRMPCEYTRCAQLQYLILHDQRSRLVTSIGEAGL